MHGPVDASRLAELAGAVEWIDDPHPFGVEPARVLAALLGEHRVIGSMDGELVGQVLLRDRVAGVLDVPRRGARGEHLLAQAQQQVTGLGREPGREFDV